MNFKIVEFLLLSALFCSAVLASVMISTDSYVASCGGDPVGGGHPCGGDPVGGGHPCGGDPVGGGHPCGGDPVGGGHPCGISQIGLTKS